MRLVTPLRFVSGAIGLWAVGRLLALAPDLLTPPAEADPPRPETIGRSKRATAGMAASPAAIAPVQIAPARITPSRITPVAMSSLAPSPEKPARRPTDTADGVPASATAGTPRVLLSPAGLIATAPEPAAPTLTRDEAAPAAAPVVRAAAASGDSRWSGDAYLFHRGDGGGTALATGGQLGGSQAGARIAWRLAPAGPTRLAVAARVSSPLNDTRGAEAAAGLDWHPLPGRPLRVSIERRIDLGGRGRNAWSAYAAGGFWRQIARGIVTDGYAQAGVVGARRRDLFADGALRAGYRRELAGSRSLTLGGGAWGAAQPGVSRVDVGPRVALGLPLAGTNVSAAAEWRLRVAGDAAPGSGLAITLASDF